MSELYEEGLHEYLEDTLKPREEKYSLSDIEEFLSEHHLLAPAEFIYDYWEKKDWKTKEGILIVTRDLWVACNVANSIYCQNERRRQRREEKRRRKLNKKIL